MDDKTTVPPAADEHAGEPDKGPGPTPAELAERADGKTAAASPAEAARAAAIADGKPTPDPLTDDERKTLEGAGIAVDGELAAAAAWIKRRQDEDAAGDDDADEAPKRPSVLEGMSEASLDRLHAMCIADQERRAAGLTLTQRVHAVVDGPHAAAGLSALTSDGLGADGLAELARIAAAMGWAVDDSAHAEHQVIILRK